MVFFSTIATSDNPSLGKKKALLENKAKHSFRFMPNFIGRLDADSKIKIRHRISCRSPVAAAAAAAEMLIVPAWPHDVRTTRPRFDVAAAATPLSVPDTDNTIRAPRVVLDVARRWRHRRRLAAVRPRAAVHHDFDDLRVHFLRRRGVAQLERLAHGRRRRRGVAVVVGRRRRDDARLRHVAAVGAGRAEEGVVRDELG